jgi:hypothetical protein
MSPEPSARCQAFEIGTISGATTPRREWTTWTRAPVALAPACSPPAVEIRPTTFPSKYG